MKHTFLQNILISWLFLISTSIYAVPSDENVAAWTGNILKKTITVDYQQLENQTKSSDLQQYYSGQAWSGFSTFFSEVIPFIIKYKLKTNPIPEGPAQVVQKGKFNGVNYWQVTQTYKFPKVGRTLWFSVIVVENSNPPLRIESLSMRKGTIPQ